jgi:CRP-like cAMP-binding protein
MLCLGWLPSEAGAMSSREPLSADWDRRGPGLRPGAREAEFASLSAAGVRRAYQSGELIFGPSRGPGPVYYVTSGRIRVYRISPEGSEATLGYVQPGELLGEITTGERPRESFAEACRATELCEVDRETYRRMVSADPWLAAAVAELQQDRLRRIEKRFENLIFCDVDARLVRTLLALAEDFGRAEAECVRIEIALTQGELATLVGATRQSVNQRLRELEARGLIGHAGRHLLLLDVERLKKVGRLPAPD